MKLFLPLCVIFCLTVSGNLAFSESGISENQKTIMQVIKNSSEIAGAATACDLMDTASDATRIRDSALDASLDVGFNKDEQQWLKSLSGEQFASSLKQFRTDPPIECGQIPGILKRLKAAIGLQ
jgi:hypothetical protein